MKRPALYDIDKSRDMIAEFKGYNSRLVIGENEFADMQNMVSDYYPVLSAGCSWRASEVGTNKHYIKLFADYTNNKLCYVDYHYDDASLKEIYSFYYNLEHKGTFNNYPQSIVMIGSKICIFPSACYYDTETNEFNNINNTWSNEYEIEGSHLYAKINLSICRKDGTVFQYPVFSNTPLIPGSGNWVDTSVTPNVLKNYNYTTMAWEKVDTYLKIEIDAAVVAEANPIQGFNIGDFVTIDGLLIFPSLANKKVEITAMAANYIVVPSEIDLWGATNTNYVAIKRTIPYMSHVVEKGNRLWGCMPNGREIYACKLGDPTIWGDFSGISTDSFAATIGSGGMFTGAISYNGYLWFFKEDRVYKIYESNYPAVQIIEQPIDGVESGSADSLVALDGALYYKSPTAIVAFTGDNVYSISNDIKFDMRKYRYGDAGGMNGKYYICMLNTELDTIDYKLFVYDINKQMWHIESIGDTNTVG